MASSDPVMVKLALATSRIETADTPTSAEPSAPASGDGSAHPTANKRAIRVANSVFDKRDAPVINILDLVCVYNLQTGRI